MVEVALRHPQRVDRVALLRPTVDPVARSLLRQYIRWQRNAPEEHLSVVPVMARDLADVRPRRAAQLLRTMLDDPIESKLPAVRCPALVVRGGRDRVVPDAWARRITDLLPHGELAIVPGYAHMAHYSGALPVTAVDASSSPTPGLHGRSRHSPGDEAPPDRHETAPSVCQPSAPRAGRDALVAREAAVVGPARHRGSRAAVVAARDCAADDPERG